MNPETTNKPLSEKPAGYLIAIAGGTLGAPIGWILSPLVLIALNNIMKEKEGKHPNRFLAWGLIGILGVPLSFAPLIIGAGTSSSIKNSSKSSAPALISEAPKEQHKSGVNMENYLKLQNGMSYEEVVEILGEQGEELSSNNIAGTSTIMYMWKAKGFSGANMNAMFQDGGLVQKSQFGLD